MRQKPRPEGLYCPNPDCALFGKKEGAQLDRHSYNGPQRTLQYLCRACGKTFSETKGTFFYRLRTPRERILTALSIVAEGGGIRSTGRAMRVDKDTIQRWVDRAGKHVREVSAYLTVDCHMSQAQLDALWTFVKKKNRTSRRRTIPNKPETSTCGGV